MILVPALRGPVAASILLLATAMAGCTPEPPPARPDGGAAEAALQGAPGPDAGAVAAPPAAGALPVVSAEALLPGGSTQPLSRDGVTTVEPSARFRLEVAARIPDARLSLLDAQDAMVAADGTVEIAATASFTLTPAAPLQPGSSYRLRLDGAEGRLVRAEDGRTFEPLSLSLRTLGAASPPPGKAKRGKRRR